MDWSTTPTPPTRIARMATLRSSLDCVLSLHNVTKCNSVVGSSLATACSIPALQ